MISPQIVEENKLSKEEKLRQPEQYIYDNIVETYNNYRE